MGIKYKLKMKDVKLEDFKVYLFALFKAILPKKKMPIENTNQIAKVINSKPLVFSQCCDCFDIFYSPFKLKKNNLLKIM